ncbi:MAG: hypothetical protein R2784_18195 [Saprospiraceae bacterium]
MPSILGSTSNFWTILTKKFVIMHPGPINRGVEITSDVADSDHSIILQQVENGVAVRMAVLFLLAAKEDRRTQPFCFICTYS